MLYLRLLGVLMVLASCRLDPLGRPCEEDNDCGPGYDCYPDVCVQVCTKEDECRPGFTCYRYHCIEPGTENQPRARRSSPQPRATPTPPAARRQPPPTPNATAAELRAIRRELELMRRDQARILQMLGGQAGHTHGAPTTAPKKPSVVLPGPKKAPAPAKAKPKKP